MKITDNDINYIIKNINLTDSIRKKLDLKILGFKKLDKDEIDYIYDKCGERLQVHGFDKDYNLTEEGKILEDLIDKLYGS